MIKTTLKIAILLWGTTLMAQTFSTGTVTLRAGYTAKVDVSPTLVTLTQVGPSDRWFSLAFNNNAMASGDIVAFVNTANISDRNLIGNQVPAADTNQDWTTTSNTVSGSTRTVVSTRVRNTGEANDFVFSNTAGSILLGWSMASSASFTLAPHGGAANAGNVLASLTLGNNEFATDSFSMFPNPSTNTLTIEVPVYVSNAAVKIYDSLGRVVKEENIGSTTNEMNIANLSSGTYIVVVRTDYGTATKNLVVN